MDPISKTVETIEHWLGHSPHPAIVTLPIGALAFSNFCDGLAMATGEEKYDDAARLSMAVGLVGAAGAVVTGLHDYSKIPVNRPSHDVATAHGLGNAVASSLFVASYVMRMNASARHERPSLASRLLAVAGGSLVMYTAWLGGKLVEEMGEGVYPAMDRMTKEEKGRGRLSPSSPLGFVGVPSPS